MPAWLTLILKPGAMNFHKALICSGILFFTSAFLFAQRLEVRTNKSFYLPGDTLSIKASSKGSRPMATLFMLAEDENDAQWEMRWPMLNGAAEAALIIPDSFPPGYYMLRFTQLQNLFSVFGKVKTPKQVQKLNSSLLTASGELYERTLQVDSAGKFIYQNVLFPQEAIMVFSLPEDRADEELDIEISTILDSVVLAAKDVVQYVYIGNTEPEKPQPAFAHPEFDDRVQTLQAVTVYAEPENLGEIFNKKVPSPLFKDINEKVIDVMNPQNKWALSAMQLVTRYIPGIRFMQGIRPYATWRGDPVFFYIDEMRSTIGQVEDLPVQDIAIIKAFPPPFFGNTPGGSGAAIAVYTRRGTFEAGNFKNAFKVKGYTPALSVFPEDPDKL